MQSSQSRHATASPSGSWFLQPTVLGIILGCLSAVGYTGANVCLRSAIHCDPIWVSCVKAVPTVMFVLPWLFVRRWRGEVVLPDRHTLAVLAVAGLLGQFGGNVMFQWSLGIIGIALTVPLCMGAIILCSALLGRIFVNESVTPLALLSMMILIIAIWALSLGAGDASQSIVMGHVDGWLLCAGVAAACVAGFSYAVLGVVIRYAVVGRASVAATIATTTLVGLLALGAVSALRLGWTGIAAHSLADWRAMLLAGLCNFVAYISLTRALQVTSLVYINALNASQVAMAAVAGVILFAEVPSRALAAGVALTILGLMLMPRHGGHQRELACRPDDRRSEDGVQKPRKRVSSSLSAPSSQQPKDEASASRPKSSDGSSSGRAACAEQG